MSFTETTTYVTETCCNCGVVFAMTRGFYDMKRKDGSWFYCPNGHRQWYTDSLDKEKKIRDLERRLNRERANHDQTRAELDYTERSRRSARGHVTRLKKRMASGKCPCCHEEFSDLKEHMEDQHPEYGGEDE